MPVVAWRFILEYEDASGYTGWADRFLKPETEQELAALLSEASIAGAPVTIVGGLTGLTGGAAAHGGWAISTEKLVQSVTPSDEGQIAVHQRFDDSSCS